MLARYTLGNGIPVFIVESHAAPVVSIQAWVSRGSIHETSKVAGISHFLEHALFKGTKKRAVGEIALEIESRGGEVNAFTSFEETVYYATLASRYFADGLDVIADAVQFPSFDASEMEREKEVILEEIKRAHDSASKMVSMNLWAKSFAGTPYGRPVLGFKETVSKIDSKTLRAYHSAQYHAGTVAIFVVGDVSAKQAFEQVKRQFSKMPKKRSSVPPVRMKTPGSGKLSVISLERDVQEINLQMAFPVSGIRHPQVPAWDLMCSVIGQGESSRLYQRLVKEKRLALDVHMGLAATTHCGMASVGLQLPPENLEPALKEVVACLEEAAEMGFRDSEVEKVKSSLESDVVGGKETVDGYARRLGYYYLQFQDPDYEKKYLEQVLAVDTGSVTSSLLGLLGTKPVISFVHPLNHKIDRSLIEGVFKGRKKITSAPKEIVSLPTLIEKGPLKFVTKRVNSLPIVSLKILFRGGSREDEKTKLGLGNLFGRVWSSGTQSYSALEIAHTLESLGASLFPFSGRHTLGLSVECLTKHWASVKPLLAEVLLHPTFPEKEFETERGLQLRDILSEKDSPGQLCNFNFSNLLYGHHPYGRSSLGTQETVSSLTTNDLKQHYKNFVHQSGAVVVGVGNIESQRFVEEMYQLCGQIPKQGKAPSPPYSIDEAPEVRVVTARKSPLFQSHILVGFLGASFSDKNRYALKILSSCLAGQGGRLFLELRDKQSLAYSVAPINSDSPERGIFGFYIGCSPEKWATALSGIRLEVEKILAKPMGAKELARAKEYWIGRFELEMQRFGAQAMLYGLDEFYGLGCRYSLGVPKIVKGLTAEDIRSAAQSLLKLDSATISIVHNELLDSDTVRAAWDGKRVKLGAVS